MTTRTDTIMSILRENGPLTTPELSDRLGVDPSTCGHYLAGLYIAGLISPEYEGETICWRGSPSDPPRVYTGPDQPVV